MCGRTGRQKPGFKKIKFCAERAREDGLNHFWVDTCCINKRDAVELQEAITSMFRWYNKSKKCYVYLTDVSASRGHQDSSSIAAVEPRRRKRDWLRNGSKHRSTPSTSILPRLEELSIQADNWENAFRNSRWFKRGWTLQELVAPLVVEFYSADKKSLGTKQSLIGLIHEITQIPLSVLSGGSLSQSPVEECMLWVKSRDTKKPEDKAYCMLGIFDVSMPLIYGQGEEEATRRLCRTIEEKIGIAAPIHTHWLVSRAVNASFVGRQDFLEELQTLITGVVRRPSDRVSCRIVIWGIGGQGKSELCLQLVHRLRQLFWAVIWVDMITQQTTETSLIEAAQKLSIPAEDWRSACSGIVNLKQPWLLVLDNAEDPGVDYQDYLPDSRFGVVLMTTLNVECECYAIDKVIALEPLDMLAAQKLLLKAARIPLQYYDRYRENAKDIAGLLSSHPLALTQAGAYIAQGSCTLAQYPRIYEQQRSRLMKFRPGQAKSRYQDVYANFEVSARMLQEMNTQSSRDALELLPLLALCAPNRSPLFLSEEAWRRARMIPTDRDDHAEDNRYLKLLTSWHTRHLPSVCDTTGGAWDNGRITDALSLLRTFALISLNTNDVLQHISMHPLVHAWARDRQDLIQQRTAWLAMGCLFAVALPYPIQLSTTQKTWIRPHVEIFLSHNFEDTILQYPTNLAVRIIVCCGWFLYHQRIHVKPLAAVDRVINTLQLSPTDIDLRWRGLYRLRAANLRSCGRNSEALLIEEVLVAVDRQVLYEKDEERLTTEYGLALSYIYDDRLEEALALLENIVRNLQETKPRTDPFFLAAQRELAQVYSKRGQSKKVVAMLEAVVNLQQRAVIADDADLLLTQHRLADAYYQNGQLYSAVTLLRDVVKISEEAYDEWHCGLLNSQHNLSLYLAESGDVEQAERLMRKVVSIRSQILDEQDSDRLASEFNFATYLWDLDRKDEALTIMAKAAQICKAVLPINNPLRKRPERWLEYMRSELALSQQN